MRNLLVLLLSVIASTGLCQPSLEVSLLSRFDKHGEYTSRYFDNAGTYDITLAGKSYGLSIHYLQPLVKKLKVNVGVGYYRLGIDNVTATNQGDISSARPIDYRHPFGIKPLFHTDQYHYNNLNLSGGIIYEQNIYKSVALTVGADINVRYSYSQKYHIIYGDIKYQTSDNRPFGYGVYSYVGVLKRLNKNRFYINPKVVVPIFGRINSDQLFGEDEAMKIDKRFSGSGLAIVFGKYL